MTNITAPAQTGVGKTSAFLQISARRKATDNIAKYLIYFGLGLTVLPLIFVLWELISKGLPPVLYAEWWTDDMLGTRYAQEGGGAIHAIIGTLVQSVLASIIAIPIGIFTAIYLVEYSRGGWLGRTTTFMVDILSGVPSIVAALFVYAAWTLGSGVREKLRGRHRDAHPGEDHPLDEAEASDEEHRDPTDAVGDEEQRSAEHVPAV